MSKPIDIVVTWPKDRTLQSYLNALKSAMAEGQQINYRVARRPDWAFGVLANRAARLYRVHEKFVRGYTEILYVTCRDEEEVHREDTDGFWPAGNYIVCTPYWQPIDTISMKGFQGWRWFDEDEARERVGSMS